MSNSLSKNSSIMNPKVFKTWFEEIKLPVAPSCNMMCNFCSKGSDCCSNGNSPDSLSKVMTPRQAVNWAIEKVTNNNRIKLIKIAGPGEPLYNKQTFEVLKRLNNQLPDIDTCVCTNGLMLKEKAEELISNNVKLVEVSISAIFENTSSKLYSRIISGDKVITSEKDILSNLFTSQLDGIKTCLENGIEVRVNLVYFPGINDEDIMAISNICKDLGVKFVRIIGSYPGGKLKTNRTPSIIEMSNIKYMLSKIVKQVEVLCYIPQKA